MKHISTWDLLDLADDYLQLKGSYAQRNAAMFKLSSIDTELLSRMPEFTYITVLDDSGNPIGFEPYIGEDNSHCYHEWIERYFGFVCSKCGAIKPVDEGSL